MFDHKPYLNPLSKATPF